MTDTVDTYSKYLATSRHVIVIFCHSMVDFSHRVFVFACENKSTLPNKDKHLMAFVVIGITAVENFKFH